MCCLRQGEKWTGLVRYTSIELLNDEGVSSACFETGDKISIRFQYVSKVMNSPLSFAFGIVSKDHIPIYRTSTSLEYGKMVLTACSGMLTCTLESNKLLDGQYYLEARIWGENEVLHDSIADFILLDIKTRPIKERGFLHMDHTWNMYPNATFLKQK